MHLQYRVAYFKLEKKMKKFINYVVSVFFILFLFGCRGLEQSEIVDLKFNIQIPNIWKHLEQIQEV